MKIVCHDEDACLAVDFESLTLNRVCTWNCGERAYGLARSELHVWVTDKQISQKRDGSFKIDGYTITFDLPKFDGLVVAQKYSDAMSRSADSDAIYPVIGDWYGLGLDGGFKIQILPARGKTSVHLHRSGPETYYYLYGNPVILIGDDDSLRREINLRSEETYKIAPGVNHQVWSSIDTLSIVAIRMALPHHPLCCRDHISGSGKPGNPYEKCIYCQNEGRQRSRVKRGSLSLLEKA